VSWSATVVYYADPPYGYLYQHKSRWLFGKTLVRLKAGGTADTVDYSRLKSTAIYAEDSPYGVLHTHTTSYCINPDCSAGTVR